MTMPTPAESAAVAREAMEARVAGIAKAADCDEGKASVAVTLADEYAPEAPIELRNEAATRTAGWLRDMSPALTSETLTYETGHSTTRQYRASAAHPLRASGGMALLARYVPRRAV